MGKYGSKKSRILSTGDSDKSKNTDTITGSIRAKIDEFIEILDDNKYKIIITITTIFILVLFIKTCSQSCKNSKTKVTEKIESSEKIETLETKEQEKKIILKKKKVITKTKKTTYKKPDTYSEPVDKDAVKKKTPQKPDFGTGVDIITD